MDRYFTNSCSEAEQQELLRLVDKGEHNEAIRAFMDASVERLSEDHRLGTEPSGKILAAILGTDVMADLEADVVAVPETDFAADPEAAVAPGAVVRAHREWIRWAAAIFLLAAGGGAYFLNKEHSKKQQIAIVHYKGDVVPGHSGAVLHLSDGRTVVLDSAANGEVARQGTIQAVKENGRLKYIGKTNETVYNTITTDRGRQWQLLLPDGTRVWLNASSSIHYPLHFTGKERSVDITGEAYFEVVHNEKMPFRVHVRSAAGIEKGIIEDLGTAFNINAYSDEPTMKTTLVEGAANVNGILLKPGEEAVVVNGEVRVAEANIPQALAWKNGFFGFDRADIHTVMRQLTRWYDVEVKFEGEPDNAPFQGKIGRQLTLAQVLKGLEQVHVHFRIEEDKRIVILP
jgi:ferric-dicitrate binding protein FerR (iron transport regulator)